MVHGGGVAVSIFAFHSEDLSSIPVDCKAIFSVRTCWKGEYTWKKADPSLKKSGDLKIMIIRKMSLENAHPKVRDLQIHDFRESASEESDRRLRNLFSLHRLKPKHLRSKDINEDNNCWRNLWYLKIRYFEMHQWGVKVFRCIIFVSSLIYSNCP